MTHSDLVKIARKWMWKKCVVVVTEMKIGEMEEVPDVIGWDYLGWSIAIECKATRSDFLRDRKKKSREFDLSVGNSKYYLAAEGLIQTHELPKGWGLLECVDKRRSPVERRVPVKDGAINPKLGKEICMLVSCLRRIRGLGPGISVRCYQIHTKARATLGIAGDKQLVELTTCIFCGLPVQGEEGACHSCANSALTDLTRQPNVDMEWVDKLIRDMRHQPDAVSRGYVIQMLDDRNIKIEEKEDEKD
jgi:hypothetical protein